MGITCSQLPYNYDNLTLPFIWGQFNGNFARYQITIFNPFNTFTRRYVIIHFTWTLPNYTRGNGNVIIILESCLW